MSDPREYTFVIDGPWKPETLPMARLAEYMTELAKVLGETTSVHFSSVVTGSAKLKTLIDEPAAPKVRERVEKTLAGDGPKDASNALKNIDQMLAVDNAIGRIHTEDNVIYYDFQGKNRPKPVKYGPFKERGSLEGVLVKIGGKDDTVPVTLHDGEISHRCTTTVELAKRLAHEHFMEGTIRVFGVGEWFRDEQGVWILKNFDIEYFETLDDLTLSQVIDKLRNIDADTVSMDEFLADMRRDGEVH